MIRIIKARQPPDRGPPAAPERIGFVDVTQELETQLQSARSQAARLVAEAEERAAAMCAEARLEGLRQAQQAIAEQVRQTVDRQLQTVIPALEQAAAALRREKAEHLRNCERQVVQLATAMAERLVRRELGRQPDIALDLIREALDLAASSGRIRLYLNPADYETLGDRVGPLMARVSEGTTTEIVADPAVTPGGCLVQTEFGTIDLQFETQLARIAEELT
jgi:flagellar assembly protein FliH